MSNEEDHNKSDEISDVDMAQEPMNDESSEETHNNLETSTLQEQEDHEVGDSASSPEENSPLDDNKDTDSFHENDKNLAKEHPDDVAQVVENLAEFRADVEDDLRWKERLKLLTLDAILGIPYYELWRQEANMLFRRSAVLKKRRQKLRKKGE